MSALGRSFRAPEDAGSRARSSTRRRCRAGRRAGRCRCRRAAPRPEHVRLDGGLGSPSRPTPICAHAPRARPRRGAHAPRARSRASFPRRAARRMRRAVGLPERDGLLVREVQAGGPPAAPGVAPRRPDRRRRWPSRSPSIDDLYAALDAPADGALALGRRPRRRRVRREVDFVADGGAEDGRARHEPSPPCGRPRPRRSTPTPASSRRWPSGWRRRSPTCACAASPRRRGPTAEAAPSCSPATASCSRAPTSSAAQRRPRPGRLHRRRASPHSRLSAATRSPTWR